MSLLIVAPVLVVAVVGSWLFIREHEQVLLNRAFETVQSGVDSIDLELRTYIASLETIARSPAVTNGELDRLYILGKGASEALRSTGLQVRGTDGRTIFTTVLPFGEVPAGPLQPEAALVDKRAVETGISVISDLFFSRAENAPMVTIEKAVPFAGRTMILSLGFPIQRISDVLRTRSGVSDWLFGVTGNDGRMLYRSWSKEKYLGQKPTPEFLENTAGRSGTFVATTLEGARVFNVYQRSPLTGWRISAAIPMSVFHAPYYQAIAFLSASVAISLALSFVLSYLYSRRIIAPVQQVRALAMSGEGAANTSNISELDELAVAVSDHISSLTAHERTQKTLIQELNHRVKNTLSLVQGLALLTGRHANSLEEFKKIFGQRLAALASSHNILSRSNWTDCDLRTLAVECCTGFGYPRRILVEGVSVIVTPNAAVKLCMVLYELATNALKHGALKDEGGVVRLTWSVTPSENTWSLRWQESSKSAGGVEKRSKGFGSEMLAALIEKDLKGKLSATWTREGLYIRIDLPISKTILASPITTNSDPHPSSKVMEVA